MNYRIDVQRVQSVNAQVTVTFRTAPPLVRVITGQQATVLLAALDK